MSEEEPWWMARCTHRMYPRDCWVVLKEAERVIILWNKRELKVHVLVVNQTNSSSCKTLSARQYSDFDDADILRLIQAQIKSLRQVEA